MKRSRSILVADRSKGVRSILARELRRDGLSVLLAGSAGQMCHVLEHCTEPLLLVIAPDLPGIEDNLPRISALCASTPCILYGHADDVSEPRFSGIALEHVEKNGNVGQIQDAIMRYLNL